MLITWVEELTLQCPPKKIPPTLIFASSPSSGGCTKNFERQIYSLRFTENNDPKGICQYSANLEKTQRNIFF